MVVASMPIAMDSISVGLPDPFSPTKNVTGALNSKVSKFEIRGMLKGNFEDVGLDFNDIDLRNIKVHSSGQLWRGHVS